jgi:hypothetical protein
MSRRGGKHQHRSTGNRKAQREISCDELLQLAARSLRDARTQHDRGQTNLTELSKQYLRDIANAGGALASCRDCFPLEILPSETAAVDASDQALAVEDDATDRPGALNGTDTEHVAACADEVASNGEQYASREPTAHGQLSPAQALV